MNIEITTADYRNKTQGTEISTLLNAYALDPMGGGKPLPETVVNNIAVELSKIPQAFSVLAYINGVAVGLSNCFESFSTFKGKPVINIHDFFVLSDYRGNGLSQKMLEKVEQIARAKGCCKITLEVLSKNTIARAAYQKFGFTGYELNPAAGHALFWQKEL